MRKFLHLILSIFLLGYTNLFAQQPGQHDISFNPTDVGFGYGDAANHPIRAIAIQPNGKIIIGGEFTRYNGKIRNHIARLHADGRLDTTFNPGMGPNQGVYTIKIQPDGKIIIGGLFTTFNGTVQNGIARLNVDGNVDTSFNPGFGAAGGVLSAALQPDGKIIIGGNFTNYNGVLSNRIARLNTNGSLDASFNPGSGVNSHVSTVSVQPDGKVIIGGQFIVFNGVVRYHIARLNANGSLDTGFNTGSGANQDVYTTAIQPDGKIIIGGHFTNFNGISRNRIARLNADGSLDTSFNPGTGLNNWVKVALVQPDNKVVIGGNFASFNGVLRNRIARLNTDGTLDTSFSTGTGVQGFIYTAALQSDGKVLIAGPIVGYNGAGRNFITRLNINSSLDISFHPGSGANGYNSSFIRTTKIQTDDKIIIGGNFNIYNSIGRNHIARLNANGSIDTTFNPGTGTNQPVFVIALQADGRIIIAGSFDSYNGTPRNRIARLNTDGSLDTSFNPGTGPHNFIHTIAIQQDGKIIIGGGFTSYNGTSINRIARLNADGSLDTSFNPGTGANNWVDIAALQPDGKIIIGGEFTKFNGIGRIRIARLNADGSLDTSFSSGSGVSGPAYTSVNSVTIQPDSKIIIVGSFTLFNSTSFNRIARLNANGSLDTSFNPGLGANGWIGSAVLQADGKIIIGGGFTSYNGTGRNCIARLNTDGSLDTTFNPGSGANLQIFTVAFQTNGQIIISGEFTSYDGVGRNRVARVHGGGNIGTGINSGTAAESRISVYPNPVNSGGVVTLMVPEALTDSAVIYVYNVLGKQVMQQSIAPGHQEISLPVMAFPAGLYQVKVTSGEHSSSTKLVIQ